MRDDIFTPQDLDRIIRIRNEAMGDPNRKVLPKRIYPDDVLFLLDLLWSIVKRIEKIAPNDKAE